VVVYDRNIGCFASFDRDDHDGPKQPWRPDDDSQAVTTLHGSLTADGLVEEQHNAHWPKPAADGGHKGHEEGDDDPWALLAVVSQHVSRDPRQIQSSHADDLVLHGCFPIEPGEPRDETAWARENMLASAERSIGASHPRDCCRRFLLLWHVSLVLLPFHHSKSDCRIPL
jgi:hypothetical protein